MLSESGHLLFLLVVCLCLIAACGWAYRRSPAWGVIVAIGAILRLSSGWCLLAISYFHWPIFQSIQSGEGFWAVAPDARVYYDMAAAAARQPTLSIAAGSPSPVYVLALAIWFRAAGATLVSAVVFNAACYVIAALAIILITSLSARRLGTFVLFSFSFSPALLLTSTQVLKDPFFAMLVVMACVSSILIFRYSHFSLSEHPSRLATGVLVALAAMAAMGGVRAYYAVFVWVAVACALFASLWTVQRRHRATFAAFAVTVLPLLWCAFAVGANAYYPYYRDLIARTTGVNLSISALTSYGNKTVAPVLADVGELGTTLHSVRMGFIGSGGGTNLTSRSAHQSDANVQQEFGDLAVGVAALFVPISALRAASVVTFNGGRGLLAITDIDTLFLDVTLFAIGVAMVRARGVARRDLAPIFFVVALVVISTVIVAYVVTNFGTLFRLRLLIAVPAWLAPLALTPKPGCVE